MSIDKITNAPTPNEHIAKTNEIIDVVNQGSGGTATDVQINGTSITSNNVANIVTNSAYNATSNKIATMSDLPTVPTNISAFNNDSGYITGINSSDVTTALGYSPTSPANVDGQWVSKVEKIVDSVSNTNSTSVYLDSTGIQGAGKNYIPADYDGYNVEVMFLVRLGCTASKSGAVTATFGSDILDMVSNLSDNMMACNKYSIRTSVIPTLPIGTSRYFKYSLTGADSNTNFFTVYALGYRRIGTNS